MAHKRPITRRLGVGPRLRALAECVPAGTETFIDVGSNHAILPIAILRADLAQRAIALDRSAPALGDARRRLRRCHCLHRALLLRGEGLQSIAPGPRDVVCLAGLGARAIRTIVESAQDSLRHGPARLVCNPLRDDDALASALARAGYPVADSRTVSEHGRRCHILVADRK